MSVTDQDEARDGLLTAARQRHATWQADTTAVPTDAERDRALLLAELDRVTALRDNQELWFTGGDNADVPLCHGNLVTLVGMDDHGQPFEVTGQVLHRDPPAVGTP